MSPRSPDDQTERRRRAEAGLWLGFGMLQGLMATVIGLYVLWRGESLAGFAAIGLAVAIVLWSAWRVRRLSRTG